MEYPDLKCLANALQDALTGDRLWTAAVHPRRGKSPVTIPSTRLPRIESVDVCGDRLVFHMDGTLWSTHARPTRRIHLTVALSAEARVVFSRASTDTPGWMLNSTLRLCFTRGLVMVLDAQAELELLDDVEFRHFQRRIGLNAGELVTQAQRDAVASRARAVAATHDTPTVGELLVGGRWIAAVGSGVASEALHRVEIHPESRVKVLSGEQRTSIVQAVIDVSAELVAGGGLRHRRITPHAYHIELAKRHGNAPRQVYRRLISADDGETVERCKVASYPPHQHVWFVKQKAHLLQ